MRKLTENGDVVANLTTINSYHISVERNQKEIYNLRVLIIRKADIKIKGIIRIKIG